MVWNRDRAERAWQRAVRSRASTPASTRRSAQGDRSGQRAATWTFASQLTLVVAIVRGHRAVRVCAVNPLEREPRSIVRVLADPHQVELAFAIGAFEHRGVDRQLDVRALALDHRKAGELVVGAVGAAEK